VLGSTGRDNNSFNCYIFLYIFTMSTSQKQANTISKLNIAQNSPNFELKPIENQLFIFKKKLFSKTLNSFNSDPEKTKNYRTVTIKCFYPSCK
jgi:hypothetical protein